MIKRKTEVVEIIQRVRVRYDTPKMKKLAIKTALDDARHGLSSGGGGTDGSYYNEIVSAKLVKREP